MGTLILLILELLMLSTRADAITATSQIRILEDFSYVADIEFTFPDESECSFYVLNTLTYEYQRIYGIDTYTCNGVKTVTMQELHTYVLIQVGMQGFKYIYMVTMNDANKSVTMNHTKLTVRDDKLNLQDFAESAHTMRKVNCLSDFNSEMAKIINDLDFKSNDAKKKLKEMDTKRKALVKEVDEMASRLVPGLEISNNFSHFKAIYIENEETEIYVGTDNDEKKKLITLKSNKDHLGSKLKLVAGIFYPVKTDIFDKTKQGNYFIIKVVNLNDFRLHFTDYIDVERKKLGEITCQSMDDKNNWEDRGCSVVQITDEGTSTAVQCECSHTTSFAVLYHISDNREEVDSIYLTYVSVTLASLSIISILFCIFVFSCYSTTLKSKKNIALMNYCIALLILYTSFVAESVIDKTSKGCFYVSVMIHFGLVAVYFWILTNSFLLFKYIVLSMSKISNKIFTTIFVFTWIISVLIVLLSAVLGKRFYVLESKYCIPYGKVYYATVLAPGVVVLLFSLCTFLAVFIVVLQTKVKKSIYGHIKRVFFLCIHLGIPLMLQFLLLLPGKKIAAWIFSVINSSLGIFILLPCVFYNKDVKKELTSSFKSRGISLFSRTDKTFKSATHDQSKRLTRISFQNE